MPHWQPSDTAALCDRAYQEHILQGVSRTFALTIPELPEPLRHAVGNSYLLCRIADTIEDDPGLRPAAKVALWHGLRAAVAGVRDPGPLARELDRSLADGTPAAERDLARNLPRVVREARAQSRGARRAVLRCLATMTEGMSHFDEQHSPSGLPDVAALERYCYHVAGVVGELLTDLFVERLPALAARRCEMRALAASFGAGLQMVNILKDVHEDRERGVCWLPRSLFARHGVDLARLPPPDHDPRWAAAIAEMTGLAHGHMRDALDYILGIPARERGLRRFCGNALGLALLTLRRIRRHPDHGAGAPVRISHAALRTALAVGHAAAGSDRLLRALFALLSRGLPRPAEPSPAAPQPDAG